MVADPSSGTPNARPRELTAFLIPGGSAVLVLGQLMLLSGVQTWLGAQRSGDFVLPASLLGSESNWRAALVVGAVISLAGLVALVVGVYRIARAVDAAAASTVTGTSRRLAPSANRFTGGLLAVVAGLAVYEGSRLGFLMSSGALGAPSLAQGLGAIVAVGGFGMLLRGTYRLVVNIHATAAAAARPSVPASV
ncbi:MAG: hypothetical protein ACOH2F_04945 [Cellulomonas sp.]